MTTPPPRIGVFTRWPQGRAALRTVGSADGVDDVSPRLLELVRLHCSVINECGFCTAMHQLKASECGASDNEVNAILAGGKADSFTESDQVALALAAAMTRLDDAEGLERAVADARRVFDPRHLSVIAFQIGAINAWNRLAITDGLEAEHFLQTL